MTDAGADPRQTENPVGSCPVCQRNDRPPDRPVCLSCQVPYPAAPDLSPMLLPSPVAQAYEITQKVVWVAELPQGPIEVQWGEKINKRRRGNRQEIQLKPPISATRPKSTGTKRMTKAARKRLKRALRRLREVYASRPRQFGQCPPVGTPCGFVSCKYNNFLDVLKTKDGKEIVKLNFPGRDIDEIPEELCSLRKAMRGSVKGENRGIGNSMRKVAACLNLVPERARQVLNTGMKKFRIGMGAERGTDEDDDFGDDEESEGSE